MNKLNQPQIYLHKPEVVFACTLCIHRFIKSATSGLIPKIKLNEPYNYFHTKHSLLLTETRQYLFPSGIAHFIPFNDLPPACTVSDRQVSFFHQPSKIFFQTIKKSASLPSFRGKCLSDIFNRQIRCVKTLSPAKDNFFNHISHGKPRLLLLGKKE